MTSAPKRDRLSSATLRTPQSVAAALPHLLGFHPEESLICMWLKEGQLLVLQRADLPTLESTATGDVADVVTYVDAYLDAAANIQADEVLIACVTKRPDRGRHLVGCTADRVSVRVRGGLVITGGRVQDVAEPGTWSWISTQDRQEASQLLGSAHAASTLPRSRVDVVAEVEFDEHLQWPPHEDSVDEAHPEDDAQLADVIEVLRRGDWSSVRTQRLLRDAALTVRGRDLILWWCARSDGAQRRALMQAMLPGLRATRHAPDLACAVAASAWMCGDGVRANAALDRCLREDPHHLMGRLVERAMTAALPPQVVAQMLGQVEPAVVGADGGVVDEARLSGYSRN